MDTVDGAAWRKSSYSGTNGGDCVEIVTWRKSTRSGTSGGDCVEVGGSARVVLVRDTRTATAERWRLPPTPGKRSRPRSSSSCGWTAPLVTCRSGNGRRTLLSYETAGQPGGRYAT